MNVRFICASLLFLSLHARAAVDLGLNSGSLDQEQKSYSAAQAEFDLSEKIRVGHERHQKRAQFKQELIEMLNEKALAREKDMELVRNKPAAVKAQKSEGLSLTAQISIVTPLVLLVILAELFRRRFTACQKS